MPVLPLPCSAIGSTTADSRSGAAAGARSHASEFDPDEEAVHVWGPVMVLPVTTVDDALRTVEMLGTDPSVAAVRVVVLDLRGRVLDDDFGAAGLESVLSVVESWGAESILTGVAPLSEHIVAELECARLLTRKELPEAIAAAFQIAEAQRHVL